MISREQAAQVKKACDIVDVAQRYVLLKRSGEDWVGRCPLHPGKRVGDRSLSVSPEWQNFRCWECGAKGDVITLVMKFEGLAYPLAVRALARQAGLKGLLRELNPTHPAHNDTFSPAE